MPTVRYSSVYFSHLLAELFNIHPIQSFTIGRQISFTKNMIRNEASLRVGNIKRGGVIKNPGSFFPFYCHQPMIELNNGVVTAILHTECYLLTFCRINNRVTPRPNPPADALLINNIVVKKESLSV